MPRNSWTEGAHGSVRHDDSAGPRLRKAALVVCVVFAGCRATPTPASAPAPVDTAAASPVAPVGAGDAAAATWRPANARLLTPWAADVRPDSVLPEYPRPQLVRPRWQSLNGLWEFALLDTTLSVAALRRGNPHRMATPSLPGGEGPTGPLPAPPASAFTGAGATRILVPFAPEAALSGVGRHGERVAYRRTFDRPTGMAAGERLLLHVGACDWHCTVYVNGRLVGDHTGGFDTFSLDVTDALRPAGADEPQELVVVAYDPTDAFGQPRGKQVSQPEGIWYTPVTGLWQTVWLEPVPAASIEGLAMTPDVAGGALRLTVRGRNTSGTQRVEAVATSDGREVGRIAGPVGAELRLPVPDARLWSPEDPFLYDLHVTLREAEAGRELDRVDSYFGMRSVGLVRDSVGRAHIALNGQRVFQVGPLDQGWWPDGLYTAPTDAALRWDLEITKQLGFNMTRKHIKVEPARWYYHADRLGLAVWQDMPSGWNDSPEARRHFEQELRAMVEDVGNHPSIMIWVPFNEKWGQFDTPRIAALVKQLDSSRLVIDASGWQHEGAGDIIDVHRYQGPQAITATPERASVVGEFGGLGHKVAGHTWAGDAWGYGGLFETDSALHERYELLMKRMWHLRDTHGMSAAVYTQLTDVEVELNGYATYDRAVMKFDTARTAAVNRGEAPYLLPELPEFTDSVRVAIHQGTPTEVRYTVDGSAPTAASALYRGPFTLRAATTVRARAFANGRPTAAPEARMEYRRDPGRPPVAVAAGRLAPGLAYALYRDTTSETAFRMLWPVRRQVERPETRSVDMPAVKAGVVATPSLEPADVQELFSMRFTGYLRVPRTGVYTFTARADDGVALWFGAPEGPAREGPDAPVTTSPRFGGTRGGGFHNVFWALGQSPATTESTGQIALAAGLHPITLTHFQAYGPRALELWIEGPGVPRQRVPASMLFHDRSSGAARAGGPASGRDRP